MSNAIADSDPLGLTPEQRSWSELFAAQANLIEMFRRNMAAIESMPDGSKVKCPCCGFLLPVEAIR